MGCQQSVPVEGNLSSGQNGPKAPLQAEFFEREVSKALESTRSTTAPPSCTSVATTRTAFSSSTVSLAVDEDDSYTLPKVDYNGRLLKEEIVKRTSASIQSSSLSLGRGAKQFELQVRTITHQEVLQCIFLRQCCSTSMFIITHSLTSLSFSTRTEASEVTIHKTH